MGEKGEECEKVMDDLSKITKRSRNEVFMPR